MAFLYRQFRTQAELDAEYDVERSVADFPGYISHFDEVGRRAVDRLRPRFNIPYGQTRAEYLDFYAGAGDKPPLLVFFHGGYWRILSSRDFAFAMPGPVANGFAVANVNYALAPSASMAEIVRQCRSAIAWLMRQDGLAFDRTRIVLAGHSAGAHLAANCLLTDWDEDYGLPPDFVRGALLVSGLYDLRPLPYTFVQPALQLTAAEIERYSPTLRVRGGLPPVIVSYGDQEPAEFQRQSIDFGRALGACGNSVALAPQPGRDHFSAMFDFEDGESSLMRALAGLS